MNKDYVFFCDNPVKPGYKVCEMHYQKNVKNATCEKANIARQKIIGVKYGKKN